MGTHKIDERYKLITKEYHDGGFFKGNYKYSCTLRKGETLIESFNSDFILNARRRAKKKIKRRELSQRSTPTRVFYLNGKWKEEK